MNILLVKLSAIGDVVHTLPSLAALRRAFPGAHITWVVEEAAADLIYNHPCLDEVLVFPRKTWLRDIRKGRLKKSCQGVREFMGRLRGRSYDLVIDFHGLFKSSLVVAASGRARKIGFDSYQELSGFFVSERVYEDMGKHAVDRYLDLARQAGAADERVDFTIAVGQDNETRVDALLREGGLDEREPFVVVSPEALWETKLWPAENFASLCERIIDKLSLCVVVTGVEGKTMGRVKSLLTRPVIDLTGRTSLRDLACLYRRALLVISTDSGPMHIAAAMGTRVVALFGPTDPARTGPYGEGHLVIRNGISCSPCFKKSCPDPVCLANLGVEEVFNQVKGYLEAAGPDTPR